MSKAEALRSIRNGEVPVPRHVAIIMDGNGRWAAARGLPRTEGHRRGVEALRRTVRAAGDIGIGILTIFSFSSATSIPIASALDLNAGELGEMADLICVIDSLRRHHTQALAPPHVGERVWVRVVKLVGAKSQAVCRWRHPLALPSPPLCGGEGDL